MDIRSLIIGFILGIIGSFIGAWFTHLFSERRRWKEAFDKASANFRAAFIPEIAYLKHNAKIAGAVSTDNLCEFLRSGYIHRHLKAFETFRLHLQSGKQEKFDKAWKEYCHYDIEGEPEEPFFAMYAEDKWEGQPTKELALRRINRLLSFAESVHK